MTSTGNRVRRATLDDVGPLTTLWQTMKFSVDDLAKRVTEFQIAESDNGQMLGAVGLQIAERQGRIYSEAYFDFGSADAVRPQLWERLKTVANNHGLFRLWTQEQAPFWSHCGLGKPDAEALTKLP